MSVKKDTIGNVGINVVTSFDQTCQYFAASSNQMSHIVIVNELAALSMAMLAVNQSSNSFAGGRRFL
jgi:hypothetical protein